MTGNCELYSEGNELPSVYTTSYGYHVGLVINPKSLEAWSPCLENGDKKSLCLRWGPPICPSRSTLHLVSPALGPPAQVTCVN